MPNFDKTGPEGKGPKTGLKKGTCDGGEDASKNGICPRGRTCGGGRGRGRNFSGNKND